MKLRKLWNAPALCVTELPADFAPYRHIAAYQCSPYSALTTCVARSVDGFNFEVLNGGEAVVGPSSDAYACAWYSGRGSRFLLSNRHDVGSAAGRARSDGCGQVRGVQVWESEPLAKVGGPAGWAASDGALRRWSVIPSSRWHLDRAGDGESRRRQIYTMTVQPTPSGLYLGFISVIPIPADACDAAAVHLNLPYTPNIGEVSRGAGLASEIYLATSWDLSSWDLDYVYLGQPLLPRRARVNGPAADEARGSKFDDGFVLPAAQPLTKDGEHWLFYEGWPAAHASANASTPAAPSPGIGVLRWREGRWAGLRLETAAAAAAANSSRGSVTTPAFEWGEGWSGVELNADCGGSEHGCAVEVLQGQPAGDEAATRPYRLDTAMWITGDSLRHRASWKSETGAGGRMSCAGLRGMSVRLRFHLRGEARLYAYRIV